MAIDTPMTLTSELLDLMEHEKAIEQGLAEIGWHLTRIRDGDLYLAAGYTTFEAYCRERLGYGRRYVNRQIQAARQIAELEERVGPMGPTPIRERQVRPLSSLSDPDLRAEAWKEAVHANDGENPTAAQVREAVERRKPPKRDHPAPFSDDILDVVAEEVRGARVVLDPFAGTGRVHELRERADVEWTIGIEIEPEWAGKHPDTILGNALDLPLEDESVDAIVTSPTYGNRMADHHDAKDDSTRLTYKHTLGRDLHEDNSGQLQWGDEYRDFHKRAWAEQIRVLRPGGTFCLNAKDHVRAGDVQHVVAWHITTLIGDFGLELTKIQGIPSRGLMAGANADARVDGEFVLTFRKPS